MNDMSINSIYLATEGEGIHIGTPQVFVRFQGCAIGCLNCDSKETWSFDSPNMNLDEVLSQIIELSGQSPFNIKRVSITGGDPLHPKLAPSVEKLVSALKEKEYFVNIEASGARVVESIFDKVNFISFDLKTPSTGVKSSLKVMGRLIANYANKSQIKAVIANREDFDFTFDVFKKMRELDQNSEKISWVLTPCYEPGEEFPKERFINIQNFNQEIGAPFRVIGQQHKWIHGPSKTKV